MVLIVKGCVVNHQRAPASSCRHARRQQAGYAAAAALLAECSAGRVARAAFSTTITSPALKP